MGAGGASLVGPLAGVIVLPKPVVVPVRKSLIPRVVVERPDQSPVLVRWDIVRGAVEPISAVPKPFVLPDGNGTLFDDRGRRYNFDGTTSEEVRDAIQAAALVDAWNIVEDLFELYDWPLGTICTRCANAWRTGDGLFCDPCSPYRNFSTVKMYTDGLIKRNVV